MPVVYSTYEAKARFSELLRKVRTGQRVVIAYRGEEVAEIRRIERPRGLAETIRRLEEDGLVTPSPGQRGPLRPLARRPGALRRFLASRE